MSLELNLSLYINYVQRLDVAMLIRILWPFSHVSRRPPIILLDSLCRGSFFISINIFNILDCSVKYVKITLWEEKKHMRLNKYYLK